MLEPLKQAVLEANQSLPKYGLVTLTWGNVSGIDHESGLVVIKPSGVPYEALELRHMVVVNLDGAKVEGDLNPSSDTPTHLVLYRNFAEIGGIVHTHSEWATGWAQAGREIPALGTTHADYFYGTIPCTRELTSAEIDGEYEKATGQVIVERFKSLEPMDFPGVLVHGHAPFCWGRTPAKALENALVLDEVAKLAFRTYALSPGVTPISPSLLDRHFLRKHGSKAYYGQK